MMDVQRVRRECESVTREASNAFISLAISRVEHSQKGNGAITDKDSVEVSSWRQTIFAYEACQIRQDARNIRKHAPDEKGPS
jgi:hypothetical protein